MEKLVCSCNRDNEKSLSLLVFVMAFSNDWWEIGGKNRLKTRFFFFILIFPTETLGIRINAELFGWRDWGLCGKNIALLYHI